MITRWPYRTTAAIWLFAMVLSVGAHHFLPLWLDISNENIPLLTMAISSAVMTIFVFGLVRIYNQLVANNRARADRLAYERTALLSLINNIPDFIYAKDTEGKFTLANVYTARQMGTSSEAIMGKTDYDYYPKELADLFFADDKKVIASGDALHRE